MKLMKNQTNNVLPPRNELSNVDVDIARLNHTLLLPIFSPSTTPTQEYTPPIMPGRTSCFSKLTSVFSISRKDSFKRANAKPNGKWGWARYNEPDKNEERPLVRRESGDSGHSADSERTLVGLTVDCGENVCSVQGEEERVDDPVGGALLALLAPAISTLQRLGINISSHVHALRPAEYDTLRDHYVEACNAMLSLLNQLQSPQPSAKARKSSFIDTEDGLEMRTLMLEALIKKIKAEQAQFKSSPTVPTPSHNPFVVHAASLQNPDQRPSERRASTVQSNPIKITPPQVTLTNEEISNRSFIPNPQQSSWAINVVRLGSFQASALFTSSPIAVRKLVGDVGKV